jgi:hypothetical protein
MKASPTGSLRSSSGKPMLHLVSYLSWPVGSQARHLHEWYFRERDTYPNWRDFKSEVAFVLEQGLEKYPRLNWAKGQPASWLVDSALRHWDKFLKGEMVDSESKLPHTYHFYANLMILEHSLHIRPEFDDRPEKD